MVYVRFTKRRPKQNNKNGLLQVRGMYTSERDIKGEENLKRARRLLAPNKCKVGDQIISTRRGWIPDGSVTSVA